LFYIDYEEEKNQELEPPQETNPMIYCHALAIISTPQTINIQGYIKNKKLTMLIDFGSTNNLISYKLSKYLNFFVFTTLAFQVMIVYGGTIIVFGKFHSIKLSMGEYILDIPMISI
jgi:hypothetical protein